MIYLAWLQRWLLLLSVLALLLLQGCGGGGSTNNGSGTANPVLVITELRWSPTNPLVGQEVAFTAVVKNIGTAPTPSGKTIRVTFSVNGSDVCWSDSDHGALAPSTAVTLTATGGTAQKATWTAIAGTFQIMALVDKAQAIQPISTPDNSLTKSLTVQNSTQQVLKIMPLGDSLTLGVGSDTSYRYYLWKRLQQAGYTQLDFVGSQHGIYGSHPLDNNWDEDHEGHNGWETGDFLGTPASPGPLVGSNGWAATYGADIVLIELGSNDLGNGKTVQATINNLGTIIDFFRQVNPSVRIALGNQTPVNMNYTSLPGITAFEQQFLTNINTALPAFNQQLSTLAQAKSTPASPVVLVDLFAALDPNTDLTDGEHPGDAGYAKLADAWYPVVVVLLNKHL
ncbi:MAG TPA: GDSL-type esterase/lipase family protein [Armatimonadota bacterium]|jgi:lysophospholipase L1-like esterase